jgi:hypothetical protein
MNSSPRGRLDTMGGATRRGTPVLSRDARLRKGKSCTERQSCRPLDDFCSEPAVVRVPRKRLPRMIEVSALPNGRPTLHLAPIRAGNRAPRIPPKTGKCGLKTVTKAASGRTNMEIAPAETCLRGPRRGRYSNFEEWVESSKGKVRADIVHERLVALGFDGAKRTTRRAVADAKVVWRAGHRRAHRPGGTSHAVGEDHRAWTVDAS